MGENEAIRKLYSGNFAGGGGGWRNLVPKNKKMKHIKKIWQMPTKFRGQKMLSSIKKK